MVKNKPIFRHYFGFQLKIGQNWSTFGFGSVEKVNICQNFGFEIPNSSKFWFYGVLHV